MSGRYYLYWTFCEIKYYIFLELQSEDQGDLA